MTGKKSIIKIKFTQELFEQIIFGMEDQEQEMVLDTVRSLVLRIDDEKVEGDEARFLPLPEWGPAQGFNLMESFVAQLRNPEAAAQLRSALETRKGVFRNFKNILRSWTDLEKQWFAFKTSSMASYIAGWYAEFCETELPETDDGLDDTFLVLEDFILKTGVPSDKETLLAMDREAFSETSFHSDTDYIERTYRQQRYGLEIDAQENSLVICAVGPDDALAGFLWAVITFENSAIREYRLVQWTVKPVFRGLGLGKALWEKVFSLLPADKDLIFTMPLRKGGENMINSRLVKHLSPELSGVNIFLPKKTGENK